MAISLVSKSGNILVHEARRLPRRQKQYLIHWYIRATRKDEFEGSELVGEGLRFKRLVVRKGVKCFVFPGSSPRRKLGARQGHEDTEFL